MNSIFYIGIALSGIFILYLIVDTVKKSVALIKRKRFRRENHEAQFFGSAVNRKERRRTIFPPKHTGSAEAIGSYGEKIVSSLIADLSREDYHVYNDLLIRNGEYTTQVDHLIVSRYGVFVLETKNIHGKVYGSGNAEYWKQYLPDAGYKRHGFTQEYSLRNPIWQNVGHIKSLRRLVFGKDVPIHGIVLFPDGTDLFVTAGLPVLQMSFIVPYIKDFREEVLSLDEMAFYRQRLFAVISTSESDRKEHLANVLHNQIRRDVAVAGGKCPLCGGTLVLRNGKYGRFYGCSNYPRCSYILNN